MKVNLKVFTNITHYGPISALTIYFNNKILKDIMRSKYRFLKVWQSMKI